MRNRGETTRLTGDRGAPPIFLGVPKCVFHAFYLLFWCMNVLQEEDNTGSTPKGGKKDCHGMKMKPRDQLDRD